MLLLLILQTANTAATTAPSPEPLDKQPALLSIVYMGGLALMVLILLFSLLRNRRKRSSLDAIAPSDLPDEVRQLGLRDVIDRIRERVGDARTYVSFDVDFVDPAFAPGTGTPEIGGFTSREAQEFVRGLAGLEIVGCDVVEVYPAYDPAQITALLAANIAHDFLSLIALLKMQSEA